MILFCLCICIGNEVFLSHYPYPEICGFIFLVTCVNFTLLIKFDHTINVCPFYLTQSWPGQDDTGRVIVEVF